MGYSFGNRLKCIPITGVYPSILIKGGVQIPILDGNGHTIGNAFYDWKNKASQLTLVG